MINTFSAFFMRRRNWTIPYVLFLAIFVVIPLLLIVYYAFTNDEGMFTFANFRKFMIHPEAINTFVYSVGIALITTILCLLLGYPAAWILSQARFNTSRTMVVLFILPMWVNILIRTLATVALFDFLNFPLGEGALIFGMVYNFLPFMVLPIYNVLAKIDDSVIIHPLAMHMVQQYAKEGYQVAVNEFQFAPRYLGILDRIDYIKLNIQTTPELTLKNIIDIAHSMKKQCIAVGIDREETYQKAVKLGVDALEGPYVAEKLTTQTHSSGYLQSNFFRLMVAMTRDEPDVEEIEQIISVDATLTYGLLRMANSCYYALRHRVTSVRQAIMTMGLSELRQWVYLLSASNAENQMEEGAEEFLRMSFMRANFCSKLMNYAKDMPISKPDAYLMGMFSTLNYLIDAPLAEILKPIPLCAEAKEALLQHTGRAGMLYDLALSYEHADWEKIDRLTGELGIPTNLLTSLYFTCMEEVNRVWIEMNRPVQGQITDDTKIDT